MNSVNCSDSHFLFTQAESIYNLDRVIFGKVVNSSDSFSDSEIIYLGAGAALPLLKEKSPAALICAADDHRISLLRVYGGFPVILVKPDAVFSYGDIISISLKGRIHRHYRSTSHNNAFLVTEVCNNLCIMCPQPPKPESSVNHGQIEARITETLDLIDEDHLPDSLCITGGEPTMLKEGLIRIIDKMAQRSPHTLIHLLTNGRYFCYESYVAKISSAARGNILAGIPLFSPVSDLHDYIVQTHGAFDQTIAGMLNCYKHQIPVELRIVLHKKTIGYLIDFAEFISKNLFFVKYVALMGMENMGYAKLNRQALFIDPWDYKDTLSEAVNILRLYGIETRIFNLPLCVVNSDVHALCAKSISDFKNIYHSSCEHCIKRDECCGFFASSTEKFYLTKHIKPFFI